MANIKSALTSSSTGQNTRYTRSFPVSLALNFLERYGNDSRLCRDSFRRSVYNFELVLRF